MDRHSLRFVQVQAAPDATGENVTMDLDGTSLETKRMKRRLRSKQLQNVFRNLIFVGWFLSLSVFLQSYALI